MNTQYEIQDSWGTIIAVSDQQGYYDYGVYQIDTNTGRTQRIGIIYSSSDIRKESGEHFGFVFSGPTWVTYATACTLTDLLGAMDDDFDPSIGLPSQLSSEDVDASFDDEYDDEEEDIDESEEQDDFNTLLEKTLKGFS